MTVTMFLLSYTSKPYFATTPKPAACLIDEEPAQKPLSYLALKDHSITLNHFQKIAIAHDIHPLC